MDESRKTLNWRTWFKSQHTLYLEAEIIRLRSELAKWQDAALQSKGLPPVSKPEPREMPHMKARLLPSQFKAKMEAMSGKIMEKTDA